VVRSGADFETERERAVLVMSYEGGRLFIDNQPVDLVHNRLVDFALGEPRHAALHSAYLDGAVVATTNPRVHTLFADKRNLVALSDPARLAAWGLDLASTALLAEAVPRTVEVTPANAEELWWARRTLFFKPFAGYGREAAYRGDKLSKGVREQIVAGGYVAQAFAPPGERGGAHASTAPLKADVRLYTPTAVKC
jgi:hypothetical protein